MFETSDHPRVFACPPGADFPKLLVEGILRRMAGQPPERLARAEIFVNTRRMQRRILNLFDEGPAILLPRIRLVTDLADDPIGLHVPAAVSPLRRRLELSQLIARLLDKEPDIAPRSAIFDLADSLALLLGEMHDEDVAPEAILNLDVTDRSGHWQRSQKFLEIVAGFFGSTSGQAPDGTARQRMVTENLIKHWTESPPQHPVIVAGSTGSRGSTALLMHTVAKLPQGAIVLPGFDFELPHAVWAQLDNALTSEDHPQFRFARLMHALGLTPSEVALWNSDVEPQIAARNRLVSLALRPAPFTNQWMREGPALKDIEAATANVALIEATSERSEALAVALALRHAAETGKTAALVTPDRLLTRRVTAALDKWKIEPDASVGEPLSLSAPGRLLRHVAELFGKTVTAEKLLVLLKHPLTNSGGGDRGQHLLWSRELELKLRREGPAFPNEQGIRDWAAKGGENTDRIAWAGWVIGTLFGHTEIRSDSLSNLLTHHIAIATALADGPHPIDPGQIWNHASGIEAKKVVDELQREAEFGGILSAAEYVDLFDFVLSRGEVRDPVRPHPNIMIWGTLEARVQGADLVILGGLNDGVWPELPSPDPWLNREMRQKSGLLVPERRIGLSAHDFQQAIAAKEVIISRSVRSAEAETVPSRWLNRLTNLMTGMSSAGETSLREMRARGEVWLHLAKRLETPERQIAPAVRPSPRPPVNARPRSLSVTAITRLIRDPYAIYAANVLRLRKLDPLHPQPDAPLRGTVLHTIFERFINETDLSIGHEAARKKLSDIAADVLAEQAPWPTIRALWQAKIERVSDVFLRDEIVRQAHAKPEALEVKGSLYFADIDFTLTGKADRIDRTPGGQILIYDYKTGSPPTKDQLKYFDKQLLLEAVMAEEGAFEGLAPGRAAEVAHIGLGSTPKFTPVVLEPGETQKVRAELIELLTQYQRQSQGYSSRRAMSEMRFNGDFDHLARFGEWDETQEPTAVEVGP